MDARPSSNAIPLHETGDRDVSALRLLIATGVYPPGIGGPAIQTRLIARALRRRGAEVCVLTYGHQREAADDGVRVEWLDQDAGTGLVAKLRRNRHVASRVRTVMREFAPDVVTSQSASGPLPFIVGVTARRLAIPSIVKCAGDPRLEFVGRSTTIDHGSTLRSLRRGLKAAALDAVSSLAYRTFDRVWATTPAVAESLVREGRVPPSRILLEDNLVDLGAYAAVAARRPRGSVGAPLRLLVVARLTAIKGVDVAVRALARIVSDTPAVLRVVGDGHPEHARELRALAAQLGVADRIEWAGRVASEHLPGEYARADLLLVPSRYEAFGVVLLEAMAAGLPIVASRIGGIPYVVDEGRCAVLVAPDAPDALADAVARLAARPDDRERLAEAGVRRAVHFDLEAGADRWVDVYHRLATRAGR